MLHHNNKRPSRRQSRSVNAESPGAREDNKLRQNQAVRETRRTAKVRPVPSCSWEPPLTSFPLLGHAQPRYLPARTRVRLVSKQPPNLVPFQTIAQSSSAAAAATLTSSSSATPNHKEAGSQESIKPEEGTAAQTTPAEKPLFRLLDETELLPPRGTRHAAAEVRLSPSLASNLSREERTDLTDPLPQSP